MSLMNENCGVPAVMNVQPANSGPNNNNGWGGDWNSWIILFLIFGLFGWGGFGGWGGGFGGGAVQQGYDTRADLQRGFDNQAVITKLDGITQGICDSTYALNNTMTNGFHGVDNAICNLGYQTQQGFNATQVAMMQGQNAIQTQLANCCCGIEKGQMQIENAVGRGFCDTNYNLATQSCDTRNTIQNSTRDIVDNQNANARAILDALTAQRIEAKDQRIAEQAQTIAQLQLSASQQAQNAALMAAMDANKAELLRRTGHDCPTAAYVVQPPTPVNFPTNCCGQATFNGGWGNGCNSGCGC